MCQCAFQCFVYKLIDNQNCRMAHAHIGDWLPTSRYIDMLWSRWLYQNVWARNCCKQNVAWQKFRHSFVFQLFEVSFTVRNSEANVALRQQPNSIMHITSLTEDYDRCMTNYPRDASMLKDNHSHLRMLLSKWKHTQMFNLEELRVLFCGEAISTILQQNILIVMPFAFSCFCANPCYMPPSICDLETT